MAPDVLIPYATALALSAVLALLIVAFRWRYLRYVRRTIYSPLAPALGDRDESRATNSRSPIEVVWRAASDEAARPDPAAFAEAWRETLAMRASFATAGAVYVVAAAVVVWHGARIKDFNINAATWLGWASMTTGVFLIVAFGRHGWKGWIAAGVAWVAGAFTLLVVALHQTPLVALRVMGTGLDYASIPFLVVAPLTLRLLRPLIVGFVPMVGLYIVGATLLEFVLQEFGLTFSGHYSTTAIVSGAIASVGGIAVAVWQIRRGLRRRFVVTLAAMMAVGLVGALRLSGSLWAYAAATMSGIGSHGLLTVATWALIARFLKIKEQGRVTDEMLHYTLCWLVLTALLPLMALMGWSGVPPAALTFALYVAALFLLLRRQRQRRGSRPPARMLLLRVFGEEPVHNQLLDALDDSWRRIGRVDLIVGADLALRSLSVRALEGFLLGRGTGRVLLTTEDVDRRIAVLPAERAFDGRFPLNELACSPTVWTHAVSMLAAGADVVLVDFRGWGPIHRGATFELSMALERVPLSRLVVIADHRTDAELLTTVIEDAWAHLPATSVNAQLAHPSLGIIRCSGRRRIDAAAIAHAGFVAAESAA